MNTVVVTETDIYQNALAAGVQSVSEISLPSCPVDYPAGGASTATGAGLQHDTVCLRLLAVMGKPDDSREGV